MHCGQARTLSGKVKPSKLMVPQREIPVSPFHIGAGTLEHLGEFGRLGFELALLHRAQLAQGPTGFKQRVTDALGKLTKRLTLCQRPSRGHAVEIA